MIRRKKQKINNNPFYDANLKARHASAKDLKVYINFFNLFYFILAFFYLIL